MAHNPTHSGRADSLALEQIHVPDNVRELDAEPRRRARGSIALQGMLVPIVVSPRPAATPDGSVRARRRLSPRRRAPTSSGSPRCRP